jgi:serine/threonine protein kinase
VARRFQHYELLIGEDGRPFELGHGAMGVTYKAFDVDLHCHVTLKVIGEKYLGDETARLRFLREARASQGSSPECCLGLSPWENGRQLLLRNRMYARLF